MGISLIGDGVGIGRGAPHGEAIRLTYCSLVTINSSGLLDMNGYTETCFGNLICTAEALRPAPRGNCMCRVICTCIPRPQASTITGNRAACPDPSTEQLIVDDGAAVDDLVFDGRLNELHEIPGRGRCALAGSTSPTSTDAALSGVRGDHWFWPRQPAEASEMTLPSCRADSHGAGGQRANQRR